MNDEEKLLLSKAVELKLNKRDLYVLIGQLLGLSSTYDLSQFSALYRAKVIEAQRNVAVLRSSINNNINIKPSLVQQNVGQEVNPPRQIFNHLAASLDRQLPLNPAVMASCKRMYLTARARETAPDKAVQLIKDCIDTIDLKEISQPVFYLQKVVEGYIGAYPKELPPEIWEMTQRGYRYRLSCTTHNWENLGKVRQ